MKHQPASTPLDSNSTSISSAERKGLNQADPRTRAEVKATAKAFYNQMIADGDYTGPHYTNFSSWLGVDIQDPAK